MRIDIILETENLRIGILLSVSNLFQMTVFFLFYVGYAIKADGMYSQMKTQVTISHARKYIFGWLDGFRQNDGGQSAGKAAWHAFC